MRRKTVILVMIMAFMLCACGGEKKSLDKYNPSDSATQTVKEEEATDNKEIESDITDTGVGSTTESETVEEPETPEEPQLIELTKNDDGFVLLGVYEQDDDSSNGPEPIEWIILAENENGILLLSRYALECKPYNGSDEDTTWETCSLRKWMNEKFYDKAFSDDEKKLINTTKVVNEDNRVYGTDCGNDTEDKVFALSTSEAIEYFELNDYWDDKDIGFSEESIAEPTPHVVAQNALIDTVTEADLAGQFAYLKYSPAGIGKPGVCWWLRDHGGSGICVDNVDNIGEFGPGFYGSYQTYSDYCARPALYISADTVIN